MRISSEEVRYIARLARLAVPVEQQEKVAQELSDILEYMEHLRRLDTENVEPLAHVLEVKNAIRPDAIGESLRRDAALANAPDAEAPYFRVPEVVDKQSGEPGDDESETGGAGS